jgi:hypothetical protein
MLPRDDVVNMKGHKRQGGLGQKTVFAAITRSLADQIAESSVHQDKLCLARADRALDCRIPMMSMASM